MDCSTKKDVSYFKKVLDDSNQNLTKMSQVWRKKLETIDPSNDEVCGEIHSTIGKANLLMNKKGRFEQFRGLIENCEFDLGEKKTTCMDLQGFWEMIYYQVEDIVAKFDELEALEANGWRNDPSKTVVQRSQSKNSKKTKTKPQKVNLTTKNILTEKRKALMKAAKASSAKVVPEVIVTEEPTVTFHAGFFNVISSPKRLLPDVDCGPGGILLKSAEGIQSRRSKGSDLRKSMILSKISMSAGAGSSSPLAVIAATKAIQRSMSRENVAKAQLDFDAFEEEDNRKNNF